MSNVIISHASADQQLVNGFAASVLEQGLGMRPGDYFYSSDPDTGIPAGQDGNAYMRQVFREARLVICVVTPAYLQSPFCLAESGVAWASVEESALLPLMLPSLSYEDLTGVLRGVQAYRLDDPSGLNLMRERVLEVTGGRAPTNRWERGREQWLSSLPGLAAEVSPAIGDLQTPDSWGLLSSALVDAALYMEADHVARAQIIHHIETDTVIPSRYHYSSDACAAHWISRCQDPDYRHQRHTREFWSSAAGKDYAENAQDAIGERAFDFVSLGPGDGEKDADLIFNWLTAGADLLYYPYDVSLPLTARAVQTVRARAQSKTTPGALSVKAVLADFQHLDKVRQIFQHRSTPNVVGLLGTMGNLKSDLGFLDQLGHLMDPGDLLMLEVRLASDTTVTQLVSNKSLRHDFGPLEHHLGLRFDETKMSAVTHTGVSSIPGTQTIIVTYTGRVPGHRSTQVTLQYIHLYEPESFLRAVQGTNFEIVHQVVDREKAFLECMLRRR